MKVKRIKEVAHLPKELSDWLQEHSDKTFASKSSIMGKALRQYRDNKKVSGND